MSWVLEVFWRFLALGYVGFGGPAAHIGYFQTYFVQKLKWIDEASYARLISLSQFLPGPGSSQIGFAIGMDCAGILGGIAAFIGFTTPSFLLLYFLATTEMLNNPDNSFSGVIQGLKLLAVIVVADAIVTMSKAFCKETLSIGIAVFSAAILLLFSNLWVQLIVLSSAALIGTFYGKPISIKTTDHRKPILVPLIAFLLLFLGLPILASSSHWLELFSDFYHAGSLMFGGGHVVLPFLPQIIGESVSTDRFLLGYAAAQAVPGPMFSMAAFLGAELTPDNFLLGALIATAGIFLPGFLLIISLQGAWESLAAKPKVAGASWGINAAVVGLLISAFYQPVFISAVSTAAEMALVLIGLFALRIIKVPVVFLVISFGVVGFLLLP